MIEKILEWGGVVFVVIGIICLFVEAFMCLRRRSNPKLTVAGMIFLTISVVGYIVTEIILRDSEIPAFVAAVWIACLWAYLICNVISALIIARKRRRGIYDEEELSGEAEESEQADAADEMGEHKC